MAEKKTFSTLDLYLSSFLSLSGIPPAFEVNNGKVIFTFPVSENLFKQILKYNSNISVPVADFVTTVKALRGQMLTMRANKI